MSREAVEVVRRIYEEGLFGRDPTRLLDELATSEIEYVNPPEVVEPGVRRGRAEVGQAISVAHDAFDSYRYELHELFDAGDSVVAALSFHARARGSANEVLQREAHTWTFREGRVVRIEWGRDLVLALEAAGLRE